jgi:hypothetical protein
MTTTFDETEAEEGYAQGRLCSAGRIGPGTAMSALPTHIATINGAPASIGSRLQNTQMYAQSTVLGPTGYHGRMRSLGIAIVTTCR